jgi:prepilin signal peptidase PulO-like enzyme (type II secretory pathway)
MPISAAVLILVLLYAKPTPVSGKHWPDLLFNMVANILGLAPFIPLLLSLNWAGRKYTFKEPQVIILFILPAFLVALFAVCVWLKYRRSIWRDWPFQGLILAYLKLWLTFGTFWWTVLSIMGYYVSRSVLYTPGVQTNEL